MTLTHTFGPRRAHGVETLEEWKTKHAKSLQKKNIVPWLYAGSVVPVAFVNGARWVCRCPNCNNGPSVSLEWGVALCHGCGAVLTTIRMPDPVTAALADEMLGYRPEEHRHWDPASETLYDLARENANHAVPVAWAQVFMARWPHAR